MPEQPSALAQAVATGDGVRARHMLTEQTIDGDAALDQLARLAAAGSPLATELLIESLDESGTVRRFAAAVLLDATAVDDVAQDSLISIAESIASFQGQSKVTSWVHSVVRRRVVDHLRRQRATTPLPPDDLAPAHRMSSRIATRATVQEALEALPELYREPVKLRDMEGLSYADVAERLGRSIGTVKSQIARGRALVAATLSELTPR